MRPITYQICNLSLDDLLILPLNRSVLEGDGVAWVGGANRRHTLLAPSIQRLHDVGPVICEGRDQARQVLLTTQAFVALAAQLLVDATGHRKGFVSHLTSGGCDWTQEGESWGGKGAVQPAAFQPSPPPPPR